jgi:hypothetical protein
MFEFAIPIQPTVTNNQTEYEALLRGLQYLKEAEGLEEEAKVCFIPLIPCFSSSAPLSSTVPGPP